MAPERIFIAIGSNIDPGNNIPRALRFLDERARLLALSTFYRSDPEDSPGSPPFINGAAEIATDLEPQAVKWDFLRHIEEALGRVRTHDKNAPRTMDLDLLLYGNRILSTPRLTLPDPGIFTYPFVAVPLLDLAPDLTLPNSARTMKEIAEAMDTKGLVPLPEFAAAVKKEFHLSS